jgi:hypothetical protein
MRHVAIEIGCVEVRTAVAGAGTRGIDPRAWIHLSAGCAVHPSGAPAAPRGQQRVGSITYIELGIDCLRLNDGTGLARGEV